MKIWVLGSGVPTPSRTRVCSGYVVEADGKYIVFDHGFGAFSRLLELGIDLANITHLFFTHLHFDHMGDYARLVLTRWDQHGGHVEDLKVFGPPPLQGITESLFSPTGVFGPDLAARTLSQASLDLYALRGGKGERARPQPVISELRGNHTIRDANWTVESTQVNHAPPYLECLAYKFTHEGRAFVYSGDTGPNDNIINLAQNCDVLVHMSHYITGTAKSDDYLTSCTSHCEAAEVAKKANAKTLVLTHISSQIDRAGVRERVIAEVSEIFKGTVILGQDLLEIPFDVHYKSHVD